MRVVMCLIEMMLLQGEQNQIFRFQIEISQKLDTSDPMLVEPKCTWQWNIYLKNCKQTADKK